jgi:hypothetical protein
MVANAGPTTAPFWTCDWLIARNCSSITTPNFTISPMNRRVGSVAMPSVLGASSPESRLISDFETAGGFRRP